MLPEGGGARTHAAPCFAEEKLLGCLVDQRNGRISDLQKGAAQYLQRPHQARFQAGLHIVHRAIAHPDGYGQVQLRLASAASMRRQPPEGLSWPSAGSGLEREPEFSLKHRPNRPASPPRMRLRASSEASALRSIICGIKDTHRKVCPAWPVSVLVRACMAWAGGWKPSEGSPQPSPWLPRRRRC